VLFQTFVDMCNRYDLRPWATRMHSVFDHLRFNVISIIIECWNNVYATSTFS